VEPFADEKNWYELRLSGKVPERRGYHSTFVNGNKVYIYGGHDIREGTLDNLWMLDLDHMNDLELQPEDQERTFKWTLVETTFAKGVPKQGLISHHTSIVHNN